MSGIAEVLLNQGYKVTGSDIKESSVTERLRSEGATVSIGHDAHNVDGADVVVFSTAIGGQNPELERAQDEHIPVIPRAEMLGELMRFQKGIAVAGTHGKTTTTSLVACLLAAGGLDPTFVVGGLVNSVQGNARLGKGDYLVAEADESDASFLHLQPLISIVTNVDADHMATYRGDFENLYGAFLDFLHNLPFYGLAVLGIDDPVVARLAGEVRKPVVTFGFGENAQVRAQDVRQRGDRMQFRVLCDEEGVSFDSELSLPGKHNVINALGAIAVALKLGVSHTAISKALAEFEGIERRFEVLGYLTLPGGGQALLVDDYAHHPREIGVTLDAAAGCWPDKRRVVVFQPHRYSRTQDLFDDFGALLSEQSCLVVTEVYSAGEASIPNADGRALCRAIRARGKVDPVFVEDVFDLPDVVRQIAHDGDVVVTLGAGNIGRVAQQMLDTQVGSEGRAAE